jgi:hypothetical protein
MSWLVSAALLPLVLCGVICLGGAVLAALGLRRATRQGNGSSAAEKDSQTSDARGP